MSTRFISSKPRGPRIAVFASLVALGAVASSAAPAQERPIRQVNVGALISAIAYTADGKTLTTWDPGGFAQFNAETGRRTERQAVFAKACNRAPALPRGRGQVVSIFCRGRLLLFDALSGAELGEVKLPSKAAPTLIAASADGKTTAVVFSGATTTVALSGAGGASDVRAAGEVEELSMSSGGERIAIGTSAGIEIRDVGAAKTIQKIEGSATHSLSGDGRRIAVLTENGARLIDVDTGSTVREFSARIAHLHLDRNARFLVGWTNQRLAAWDTASGKQLMALTVDTGEWISADVSPDGTRLATLALDRRGESTTSSIATWRLAQ